MKDWEKELHIYRLDPAPPGKQDLQEYIALYYAEEDETYFSWFLHYYEKVINTKVMGYVQRFAIHGHFIDLKQTYVMGMMKALKKYDISRGGYPLSYTRNTTQKMRSTNTSAPCVPGLSFIVRVSMNGCAKRCGNSTSWAVS